MATKKAAETKVSEKKNSYGKNTPLIREAYNSIKNMIFDHKLVPGQRLVYQDLVRMLKISQTPIINALNRLLQDGFVAYENYCGFYVKPMDLQEVWEAFGVREALEVYAVRQAIERWSPEGMSLLSQILRDHEKCTPPRYTSEKFRLDTEFHLQIATMSGNQVLRRLLRRNFEHIFMRVKLENYSPERMAASAAEHRRLLERMKKKDVLGSMEILRNHIQNARDQVIRCLAGEEQGESLAGTSA
ncbi:MAG: GntR family transcriptional regulator [Deltaproteobacteria bacterium]|nr:GntR family transcriptional regulator [Deltaproteobacteria bacterium]